MFLYGSGSAYFAPSAAILEICKAIINNKNEIIPVSAYLTGEYAIADVCIGVPVKLSKTGIEKIVELDLNNEEKSLLLDSAKAIKQSISTIYPKNNE